MLAVSPAFLRYGSAVKSSAEWLQSALGCDLREVARIAHKSPQVLGLRRCRMQRTLDFLLHRMQCSPCDAKEVVMAQPQIFSYSVDNNLGPKLEYLRSLGVSEGGAIRVFRECPQVIGASLAAMQAKVDYLRGEWGLSPADLTAYPQYLSFSLQDRIRPRHRFALYISAAGIPKPKDILLVSERQFCLQVGSSVPEYRAWQS
eukprot:CAMPEP_0177762348 /NCGR_PEP_ID=MMETSP0491_2-20121128/6297_1 /TAXON_ID=63592 /ORGANISM="Tetraselmis chuii, Strain PLY429" /LENGTH=201 /DNA_ID=CAMNT_0019278397 /DNA_START=334 /DNA_END=936 /DNA_ORIENTATION=-